MNEHGVDLFGEPGHDITADDAIMCKQAMRVLNTTYPGYRWFIGVNSEGGILFIKCLDVSTVWAYVLHLDKLRTDPTLKRVRIAAGELLERASQRCGPARG
ncbi:hypothetical protein LCGC14_3097770, partial [marine sediment metagenome]